MNKEQYEDYKVLINDILDLDEIIADTTNDNFNQLENLMKQTEDLEEYQIAYNDLVVKLIEIVDNVIQENIRMKRTLNAYQINILEPDITEEEKNILKQEINDKKKSGKNSTEVNEIVRTLEELIKTLQKDQ